MLSDVAEMAMQKICDGCPVALVPWARSTQHCVGALRSIYPCVNQGPHHDASKQGVVGWIMTLDPSDALYVYGELREMS